MNEKDIDIIALLKDGDERGMEMLFKQYYNYMCHAVYKVLEDSVLVEDIVQEVFYEFWRKREGLKVATSLKAYLRRSCVNKALNSIRDQKIKFDGEERILELDLTDNVDGEVSLEAKELEGVIHKAIESLPEKCKIVFMLSRFEEMSYKEIAKSLEVSVKTVENQISKALKILRIAIHKYKTA